MVIPCGIFRLRHDDTAHPVTVKLFADTLFLLVFLVALGNQRQVAPGRSLLFDPTKNGIEVMVDQLWDDHANHIHWLDTGMPQLFSQDIRKEVMLTGIRLYLLPSLLVDMGVIGKCTGNCRYRDI